MMRSFLPAALLAALSLYLAPASVHAQGEGGDGDCPGGYTWADSYLYADSYGWLYGYSTTYNVCSDVNISVGVAATVYDPSSNSITGGSQWSYWDGGDATVNLSAPAMSAGQYFIVGTHYLCYYDASWVEADPYNTQDSTYSAGPVPTVTGSLIDMYGVQTTWYADGSPNAINIWGIDLTGMIPTITGTGCSTTTGGSAWSISGWSSSATSLGTNLTVSPYLSTACTITISLLGWLAQVNLSPPPTVTVSSAQSISDGGSGSFTITAQQGTPSSYAWSFSYPTGSGNSPSVTFGSPTGATTSTDGHWFAYLNGECLAAGVSTYTITGSATFPGYGEASQTTSLSVNAFWKPAGYTPSPQLVNVGFTETFKNGSYSVASTANTTRWSPTDADVTIIPSSNSQFYNKVFKHEHVHVLQNQPGGSDGDLFTVSGLAAAVVGLHDTTEAGLKDQFNKAYLLYYNQQNAILKLRADKDEISAYGVSDQTSPNYIYDSTCGYDMF